MPPRSRKLRKRLYGQVANALVSWIGWNGVLCGLTYVLTAPVCVSVTVRMTLTSVKPPANVQYREFTLHPFRTLITISTFSELKNQKAPVSPVREITWPD